MTIIIDGQINTLVLQKNSLENKIIHPTYKIEK